MPDPVPLITPFASNAARTEVRIPLRSEFRFAHEPVNNASASRFVGRSVELDALLQRILFSEGGSFLVTGYRGVGKTSFVGHVIRRLREATPWAASVLGATEIVDVHLTIARPLLPAELMHHIIRRLHDRLKELKLLGRLDGNLREQLAVAYQRTSANMARKVAESTGGTVGLSDFPLRVPFLNPFKVGLSHTRSRTRESSLGYLVYDDKAAEHDIIDIAQQLTRGFPRAERWWSNLRPGRRATAAREKLKVVFVFDELDKLDDMPQASEQTGRTYLEDLIHSLKNLFTTSGICFVFVAGKDLHDRWLLDLGRGDSVYESVFCYDKYLPCMWNGVDAICDGVVDRSGGLQPHQEALFDDFKRYLDYRGRGIPRRIIRALNEQVQWEERPYLLFTRDDIRLIRFYAGMERLLHGEAERLFPNEPQEGTHTSYDRRRLGVYYLVDWVLGRGNREFTATDVVKAARALSAKIALADESAADIVAELIAVLEKAAYVEQVRAAKADAHLGVIDDRKEAMYCLTLQTRSQTDKAASAGGAGVAEQVFAGRYSRLAPIGAGGMGVVYKAFDRVQGRHVAVKKLRGNLLHEPEAVERFKREAALMRALRHPNIVEYLDAGEASGEYYIAMEYINGVDLTHILSALVLLSAENAVAIALGVSRALEFLHGRRIVRSDIKPGNILVTAEGRVAITDFGIAKSLDDGHSSQVQTAAGSVPVGTPYYMAPEQIRGTLADARVDIYALGIVLYEMLTGIRPFAGNTNVETLNAHLHMAAPPPSVLVPIDAALDALVVKAMAKEPELRFQTSAQMSAALAALDVGDNPDLASLVNAAQDARAKHAARDEDQTAVDASAHVRPSPHLGDTVVPWSVPTSSIPSEIVQNAKLGSAATTPPEGEPPSGETLTYPPPSEVLPGHDRAASDIGQTPAPSRTDRFPTLQRGAFASAPSLVVREGAEAGRRFELPPKGQSMTIGRAGMSDIALSGVKLSRVHARVECDANGKYWIIDLNSLNGTLVNGTDALKPLPLLVGDSVQVGDVVLTVAG